MNFSFSNIKTYIIHIKGNEEREKFLNLEISKLRNNNIEIFDAISPDNYKQRLTLNEINYFFPLMDKINLKITEKCCSFSHVKIIQDAIKNNYDYIYILEDDFRILPSYERKINFIESNNLDFDMLYMGGWMDKSHFTTINKENGLVRPNELCGTHAYILNKKFYKTIIDTFYNSPHAADAFYHRYIMTVPDYKIFAYLPFSIVTYPCRSEITGYYRDLTGDFNVIFKNNMDGFLYE
jgi:GR25 family glycosyltransferase involved in LPS biosynthesis